jgi:Sigma-70, region 4
MDETNQNTLDGDAGLSKLHIAVIKSLYASPVNFNQFKTVRYELRAVEYLLSKGLAELSGKNVALSKSGYKFAEYLIHSTEARKERESDLFNKPVATFEKADKSLTTGAVPVEQKRDNPRNKSEKTLSPEVIELRRKKLEKSNEFLRLYKEGLTYQEIGDKHEISKERVRQLLKSNPNFYEYIKQSEEEKRTDEIIAKQEKEDLRKHKLYSKSLGVLYPDRVAELWDYEKNEDLNPNEILAGSASHSGSGNPVHDRKVKLVR